MSIELLSTAASFGTFVVIGATALAAVVQLRHLRASNQLHAMLTLVQMEESPGLEEKLHFVRAALAARMEDADFLEGSLDFVVVRALGKIPMLLNWARSSLQPDGRVVLWLGAKDSSEVSASPGWIWRSPVPVPHSERRVILVGKRASAEPG